MSRVCLTVLALGTIALLAAGCGKSSSRSAATDTRAAGTPSTASERGQGPALTRARYVARANAICARAKARSKQIKAKNTTELELALPQAAAYQRLAYLEFSKLAPPVSMAEDWRQIVTNWQVIAATIIKLYEGARANLPASAGTPLWSTLGQSTERLRLIARRDGLRTCARP
jgi:hypothetical protein